MTKVVSMARTSEYWISRARKHRLAGRYDEAMALLAKTQEQYGTGEALERELAQTYDEMGCEEEAARAYLRVARMKGEYRAEALFQLALSAAQRAELTRAASYFEQFEKSDRRHVSPDLVALLGQQLRQALEKPTPQTRRERAKALERRAVERLQEGRVYAARRTMLHAIDLWENAQRLTLLACCELILGRLDEAQTHAEQAHALASARVQTLCVLIDVLYTAGKAEQARRMLHIAVLRAQSVDERLNVSVESAKHGEDGLTLRLTRSLLRRDPYCMRGMMLRGCALMNLRRFDEAKRVFGRLCVLLPEDTVCQAYYAMARNEQPPEGRLTLGLDVPPEEAVNRAVRIISAMAETPLQGTRELYELSAWALRSAIAGTNTALLAMMLMIALETPEALDVLLDALIDPQVSDGVKRAILQALTASRGFQPYDVDIGGRYVRLAAGALSGRSMDGEAARTVVQAACDALAPDFPQAPKMLLPMYIAFLEQNGVPKRREQPAYAAALEYLFHRLSGRKVGLNRIAAKYGVSPRLCRTKANRILRAVRKQAENNTKGSVEDEMHQL